MAKHKNIPGVQSWDRRTGKAVLRLNVPGMKGGEKRQKTVIAKTEAELNEALATLRLEIAEAMKPDFRTGKQTMSEYYAAFEDSLSARVNKKGRKDQNTQWLSHVQPHLGHYRLDQLNDGVIEDYVTAMLKTPSKSPAAQSEYLSTYYINRLLVLIGKVLNHAWKRGYVTRLPYTRLPKQSVPYTGAPFTVDEYQAFMSVFDDEDAFKDYKVRNQKNGRVKKSEHYEHARRFGAGWTRDGEPMDAHWRDFQRSKAFWLACFQTGLDASDVRKIRWGHVRFDLKLIDMPRGKTNVPSTVPLSGDLEALLKELHDENLPDRREPGEAVFCDPNDGNPYSESTLKRYFENAKALAGIKRRFRMKDMRHTYGTLSLNAGANLGALQRSMGHTTSKMTEHYARYQASTIRDLRESIDKAFPSVAKAVHKGENSETGGTLSTA